MAAKSVTSAAEVSLAQKFLKLIHADASNVYMIDAIIAWLRINETGKKVTGNNPFGIGTYKMLNLGRFGMENQFTRESFKSLDAGLRATANALLHNAAYSSILAALQRKISPKLSAKAYATAAQKQGEDFIDGLSQAMWSPDLYGDPTGKIWEMNVTANKDGKYGYHSINKLFDLWATLLGHPVNLPVSPSKPAAAIPFPPLQPMTTGNPVMRPDYILPYEARDFLAARNSAIPALKPV